MNIALIADSFAPMQTASAIQMAQLAEAYSKMHPDIKLIVIAPDYDKALGVITEEDFLGFNLVRFGYPNAKNRNVFVRFIIEFFMPFFMFIALVKTKKIILKFHKIIIYSPSAFLWQMYFLVRKHAQCKKILILRDIFPQWAYYSGLIKNKVIYKILLLLSYGQYQYSNILLVQSPGDKIYIEDYLGDRKKDLKIMVFNNWLVKDQNTDDISDQNIAKILQVNETIVYAGNIGPGQDIDALLKISTVIEKIPNMRFILFGRGYDYTKLQEEFVKLGLLKSQIFDEIPLSELRTVFRRANIGVVSLNPNHVTNNIPGKYVAYLRDGLPIIAFCNSKNDLAVMIKKNDVGFSLENNCQDEDIHQVIQSLLLKAPIYSRNCRKTFSEYFDVQIAVDILSRI